MARSVCALRAADVEAARQRGCCAFQHCITQHSDACQQRGGATAVLLNTGWGCGAAPTYCPRWLTCAAMYRMRDTMTSRIGPRSAPSKWISSITSRPTCLGGGVGGGKVRRAVKGRSAEQQEQAMPAQQAGMEALEQEQTPWRRAGCQSTRFPSMARDGRAAEISVGPAAGLAQGLPTFRTYVRLCQLREMPSHFSGVQMMMSAASKACCIGAGGPGGGGREAVS